MTVYRDADADLGILNGRTTAVLGYGNQGRAQALNLRDSGVSVIVGNIRDESFARAEGDGFAPCSISEAAARADILCLFLPDEVQAGLYERDIRPSLAAGKVLDFAHGYAIRYGLIRPPRDVDVVMVAPRMIGVGVRERFLAGGGAPAFVAVEQDATGHAWPTALAIAKGIGATRAGALRSSFAEETELDHFSEQAVWPAIVRVLVLAFETLVEAGYQPEAVVMDLYASGEGAKIWQEMADTGLFKQMRLHSRTSQYGTLSRAERMLPEDFRQKLRATLAAIRDGSFSREWEHEQATGYPVFDSLRERALAHPLTRVEERLRELIR